MQKKVNIMKVAICDDEKSCRMDVLEKADEYNKQNSNAISFSAFSSAKALIEATEKSGGFDVYVLDIVMPEMNGIELGKWLRDNGHEGKIIYLTSSEEYAIESYRVKAFDYILKPVEKDVFFKSLDEIVAALSSKSEKSIIVKTKENSIRLTFDSIMYAELCRRVIVYHLSDGKTVQSIMIRTTFSEAVQELLRDSRFVLCGAGMVANLQHITMVDNEALDFKNSCKVYLSKKACREVRSAWYDYWFDGEGSKW